MLKAALKNLLAHKTRLALTSLAVVLGVAFISGTFVYADTTRSAFDGIFADAYAGIDVVVTGESEFRESEGVYFETDLVDVVASVEGVENAHATLQGSPVGIIGPDGEQLGVSAQSRLGGYLPQNPDASIGVSIKEGRAPLASDEVVIDASSAAEAGYEIGDIVEVVTEVKPARPFTVVGIAGFGESDNLGGATLALFDLATIQALIGKPGLVDGAFAFAKPGADVDDLITKVAEVVPDNAVVRSGQSEAEEEAAALQGELSFIYNFLGVFAAISLFVGTFIIYNTFRIVVAQRTRELALLRAIGSTRRQVLLAVLVEAAAVGVISSMAGLGVGLGISVGLREAMATVGFDLPSASLVIAPRTIVVAIVVGLLVTSISAILPAWSASRIPPVAAMQTVAQARRRRPLRRRLTVGALLLAIGAAAIIAGLAVDFDEATQRLALVGPGAVTLVLATQVLSAPIARPMAKVIGSPFTRILKAPGRLAQENAGRSPRRTSATSAAIMVAVALITTTTVMAASVRGAVDEVLDQGVTADLAALPDDALGLEGFSAQLADDALALDEIDSATRLQFGPALVDGEESLVGSFDERFEEFFTLEEVEGTFALEAHELFAMSLSDKTIGDAVELTFEDGTRAQFTIAGAATSQSMSGLFLSRHAYAGYLNGEIDRQAFFRVADGVDVTKAETALEGIARQHPTASIKTMDELRSDAEAQVNQMLGLVTALLGLSVLIALIGVTNTMTLAVHERTREIGLLRAVGLTRRQTKRMIWAEASIISTFGAVLGVGAGILFSWALWRALAEVGFTQYVIPTPSVAGWVIATGLLGILFALWPARTAARLNVLDAISYE